MGRNYTFIVGLIDVLDEFKDLLFCLFKSLEALPNPRHYFLPGFDVYYKAILVINFMNITITSDASYMEFV